MLPMSFRWVGRRFVPLRNPCKRAALGLSLLMLAGCGGGGAPAVKVVQGAGYRFSAPAAWAVSRSGGGVQASQGLNLVSVTRYPLLRAYRPGLWARVVPELDTAAAQLAKQQKGHVGDSRTVTVAGGQARRYDINYERAGNSLV